MGGSAAEAFRARLLSRLPELVDLACAVCRVPSPTDREERKAAFLLEKLRDFGVRGASIDAVGNVLCPLGPASQRIVLLAAHMDTVFPGLETIQSVARGGRIHAPSLGDNSVNVAALLLFAEAAVADPGLLKKRLLLAFTVGEEGLGNLRGMREVCAAYGDRIDAAIAVDGGFDSVVDEAVGSLRYSVTVETRGGHSWMDFGRENAIHLAARMIGRLYAVAPPASKKTTYNVGIIEGGTSVNSIPSRARFLCEVRSGSPSCLREMEGSLRDAVAVPKETDARVAVELLGERPCGRLADDAPLRSVVARVRTVLGLPLEYTASSTDASIPLGLGVPGVSFGVCRSAGVHTLEESIDPSSLKEGMAHLVEAVLALAGVPEP